MFRIVLLIILFMIMAFTLVANVTSEKTGRPGVNVGRELNRHLKSAVGGAERLAPELGDAIGRVDAELAKLAKKEGQTQPPSEHVKADLNLSGGDFTGLQAANNIFAGAQIN